MFYPGYGGEELELPNLYCVSVHDRRALFIYSGGLFDVHDPLAPLFRLGHRYQPDVDGHGFGVIPSQVLGPLTIALGDVCDFSVRCCVVKHLKNPPVDRRFSGL